MKRVRNVLLRSSIVGFSTTSSSLKTSTARRTVALKVRSMSARQTSSVIGSRHVVTSKRTFLNLFVLFDYSFSSLCILLRSGRGKGLNLVRSFGAPTNIYTARSAEVTDDQPIARLTKHRADCRRRKCSAPGGDMSAKARPPALVCTHEDIRKRRCNEQEREHGVQKMPRLHIQQRLDEGQRQRR